jgi:hypothetical protein
MGVTPEEARNGWTEAEIEAYRAEREAETKLVGGNVVTGWERPRQLPRIENTLQHKPHRYWR